MFRLNPRLCQIGGRDIACSRLTVRELNFGQPVPGSVRYRVELGVEDLVDQLEDYYQEIAEDDRSYGDQDGKEDQFTRELRAMAWPPLRQLAQERPRLLGEVVRMGAFDVFLDIFRAESPEYVINTVERAYLMGNSVFVEGEAYSMPSATQPSGQSSSTIM